MPVRKIPISYRNITGLQTLKRHRCLVPFESILERDFLVLVDFDWNVASIEEQPVRIHWTDKRGRSHPYTPDFLVRFLPPSVQVPGAQPGKSRPWLVEVKDTDTLRKKWTELRPRFQAATRYALDRGWTFRLFTDRLIRTPFLDNARRLLETLDAARDPRLSDVLLRALACQGTTTPLKLVSLVTSGESEGRLIQTVYQLIAEGKIGAALDQPISTHTPIWAVAMPSTSYSLRG